MLLGGITVNGPTRVAIVGPGAIAHVHAIALRACGAEVTIVAGTSLDQAQAFARRHRIPVALDDPDGALTSDAVDVVVIASPHAAHVPQTERAMTAGKHVLVEVPFALSLQEAESLVALASSCGVRLGVCHTMRFHETVVQGAALVRGTTSRPSLISARRMMNRVDDVGWTGNRRTWTDSLLWHHGAHVIDTLRAVTGSEFTVAGAVVGTRTGRSGEALDYAVSLESSAGTAAVVTLSYTSHVDVDDMIINLEDETLVITPSSLHAYDRQIHEAATGETLDDATTRQDAAFLQSIREGSDFATEGIEILGTLRVLEDIQGAVHVASVES